MTTQPGASDAAAPRQPERPGRYQRSPGGLLTAMVVLLLVVAGFVALRGFVRGNQDTPPPDVAYAGAVREARASGLLAAPAPGVLPEGWRSTSVRFMLRPDPTWHVGLLSPKQTYVGIEEAAVTEDKIVASFLDGTSSRGEEVTVDGVTWRSWTAGRAFALTRRTPTDTVFVGGPAGKAAVLAITATLESATPSAQPSAAPSSAG